VFVEKAKVVSYACPFRKQMLRQSESLASFCKVEIAFLVATGESQPEGKRPAAAGRPLVLRKGDYTSV
jgi:hypothetical protein